MGREADEVQVHQACLMALDRFQACKEESLHAVLPAPYNIVARTPLTALASKQEATDHIDKVLSYQGASGSSVVDQLLGKISMEGLLSKIKEVKESCQNLGITLLEP